MNRDPDPDRTNKAGKAIKVGSDPVAIAIHPEREDHLHCQPRHVPGDRDTVTPIRTATNKVGKAITEGSNPVAIAITP